MAEKENNPLSNLTQEEIDNLKEQLLESIYADIGRNVVKKALWIFASAATVLMVWLGSKHV